MQNIRISLSGFDSLLKDQPVTETVTLDEDLGLFNGGVIEVRPPLGTAGMANAIILKSKGVEEKRYQVTIRKRS